MDHKLSGATQGWSDTEKPFWCTSQWYCWVIVVNNLFHQLSWAYTNKRDFLAWSSKKDAWVCTLVILCRNTFISFKLGLGFKRNLKVSSILFPNQIQQAYHGSINLDIVLEIKLQGFFRKKVDFKKEKKINYSTLGSVVHA